MWLFFALLTPLFWAVVHVLDAHCVRELFEKPWMGMITSALASGVAFIFLPVVFPAAAHELPTSGVVFMALLAGFLIQVSQAFYFQALAYSEAGIVAAYWNMTPALLPVVSYVVLLKVLSFPQYVGIGILILTSVLFCLLDTNFHARWRSFFLMFVASILQVTALLLEDEVFHGTTYPIGFLLITTGLILTGTFPLLHPKIWNSFRANWPAIRAAIHILIGIEVMNLFALATSQRAIDLGVPSLVAAIETTIPGYIFLLSLILLSVAPRFADPLSRHKILEKFSLVGMMVVGIWLVS